MTVCLVTNDGYFLECLSMLFGECRVVQYGRPQELNTAELRLTREDMLVHAVKSSSEVDWGLVVGLVDIDCRVFLMMGQSPRIETVGKALRTGVTDVLLAPELWMREKYPSADELCDLLKVGDRETNESALINVGKSVYFHSSELWVGTFEAKKPLSRQETVLLKIFLENEGRVLYRNDLQGKVWGYDEKDSSLLFRVRGGI